MIKCVNIISDTNIGGAGKVLLSYLENRDRDGFEQVVVVPRGSLLIPELKTLGVRIIEFDGIADKSFDMRDIKGLTSLLKKEAPDVVHCHGAFSGRIAATRCGIKTIHTHHCCFEPPAYKKRFPAKEIFGAVNNHYSDAVIAVSPVVKDMLIETGTDPKKIEVIYNGISHPPVLNDEEKRRVRQKYGVADDAFLCAIIARLEEEKGHRYLLEAAKILEDQGEGITLIIAGAGSLEESLRAEAKAKGLSNVIFTGFIKEIWEVENIMDLQINASHLSETTSLSLLEGMCLGVPAVVSDVGGNPHVIQNGVNGLLFPKKDSKSLADAILRCKNDSEFYRTISKNCPEIFEERFTGKVMAQKMEAIYRRLAGKGE